MEAVSAPFVRERADGHSRHGGIRQAARSGQMHRLHAVASAGVDRRVDPEVHRAQVRGHLARRIDVLHDAQRPAPTSAIGRSRQSFTIPSSDSHCRPSCGADAISYGSPSEPRSRGVGRGGLTRDNACGVRAHARGESTMMDMPAIATSDPATSQTVGRMPSTSQSQTMAVAT